MAGGEGRRKRRTTKSVATATGEVGAMQPCSNKRKAVTTGPLLRPCSAGKTAGKEEASSAGISVAEGKNELTAKEIKWILAQKPLPVPRRYEELKRSNPELTPRPGEEADDDKRRLYVVVKGFFDSEEQLPKVQEWVREQLATKGKVVLDDGWAKQKAEGQAMIDRAWPKIEARIQAICLKQAQAGCL